MISGKQGREGKKEEKERVEGREGLRYRERNRGLVEAKKGR